VTAGEAPRVVRRTVVMSPELQAALDAFRWRMQRARVLVSSPADMAALGLRGPDAVLVRKALESYLRENSD
jgi:hypothetical protein